VAVARAIQAGAQILFLDEPLAGLDKPGIDQVLYLLDRLVRIRHITIVIVEHVFHIPRILDLASTVWTLTHGRLIVQTPAEVRSEMAHTIGDGLKPWVESMVGNEGKVIEHELARGAVLSVLKTASELSEEAILEIKGLVVYRGNRLVIGLERDGHVEGLSFSLRAGEIAVLHAPNGWGKTTLLEAIAGLLPISAGEIKIHGYPVQSLAAWDRFRLGLSLLQAKNNTFPNLTVKEMLCLAKIRSVPSHLQSFRDRRVVDLSGGEKQRLAITCALEPGHARLRLLDEPFSMLDHAAIQSLQQSLKPSVDTSTLIAVPSFQQY
jgi:ABC-type multidrug transport system ATPase subunit